MRWLLVMLAACTVEPDLRVDPPAIDLDVVLDTPTPVALRVFDGDADVTARAQLAIDRLGTLDGATFISDGRTGGRATITATYRGQRIELPVHVRIHSTRFDNAPSDAASWFAAATDAPYDASLEPGDGAVLPPNLGGFDVDFAAPDTDDVHEVAFTGPDLDIRVYASRVAGPRHVELTAAESNAVSRTSAGGAVDLAVRSLRSMSPTDARLSSAHLSIAELRFAGEVLFTGMVRLPADETPQMWVYSLATAKTEPWANGPGGSCIGCHAAFSRDGTRIAAGDANFQGVIIDAATRYFLSTPGAAVGLWNAATFDPSGSLVTGFTGTLTLRDGTTALPIKTLPTHMPAAQPVISPDGRSLAYVAGPIDPVSTQPINEELSIHDWRAATGTLGPPRVLVPKQGTDWPKLPDFTSDGRWLVYARMRTGTTALVAVRADGSSAPIDLTAGSIDDLPRMASSVAGDEPMVWIVMKSYRSVGVRPQDRRGQLWALAFYPERGVASRPFHLPGQRPDVAVLHAPITR